VHSGRRHHVVRIDTEQLLLLLLLLLLMLLLLLLNYVSLFAVLLRVQGGNLGASCVLQTR
jgi:hypothetical protein